MIVPLAIRSLDHAPSQPRHATTPRKHLATSAPVMPADLGAVIVEVDLLLTELLGHPLLIGHGVLVEPDPLPRHDPLLDHRLLLTQHHLMLGLGEVRPGGGGVEV